MDRELTYQVPFERLRKLGRRSGRKAFPNLWLLRWALLAVFLGLLILMGFFEDAVERWQASLGLPPLTALVGLLVVYVAIAFGLRRYAVEETKARADFQSNIRLLKDDGGVHIATDEIEYYLKWRGISQMLMEPDGVVLSHASLFFLVPDAAFQNAEERNAFVREIYGRLSPEAQARSEKNLHAILGAAATPARS